MENLLEIIKIYKRNFPFIIRENEIVTGILSNKDNVIIEERNRQDRLVAVSVINGNAILLLCVDKEYRNQGIASKLLKESESIIIKNGYNKIIIGIGPDYIMPGVPLAKSYYKTENEKLSHDISNNAAGFFTKRGYVHSCNCDFFDMKVSLDNFEKDGYNIGDTIENVTYKWATEEDIEGICQCTDDAYQDFTKYYKDRQLYNGNKDIGVLIAVCDGIVAGTLIVKTGYIDKDIGGFGCLTVRHDFQGKYIAVNLITIGTKYLKSIGLKEAFIGYTYSGLDHLYGYAGYKIWVYYMMAVKEIPDKLSGGQVQD